MQPTCTSCCEFYSFPNSNPLLSCHKCKKYIHLHCYDPHLKLNAKKWLCEQCRTPRDKKKQRCFMCPSDNLIMKNFELKQYRTSLRKWIHLCCLDYVRDIVRIQGKQIYLKSFNQIHSMYPFDQCYICRGNGGYFIGCSYPECKLKFHVGCAVDGRLILNSKSMELIRENMPEKSSICGVYCRRHIKRCYKKMTNNSATKQIFKLRIISCMKL